MPDLLTPQQLERVHRLLDQVAERQRIDFGHIASDVKPDGSLITACDRWSDSAFVQGLAEIAPGEGVLSEEGSQECPSSQAYWVVDPLDGTKEFINKTDEFTVNIALIDNKQAIFGIVAAPVTGKVW